MLTFTQKAANLLRTVAGSDKRIQRTSAVIVAGGSSTRMNENGITKQHMLILGIPCVVRTIMAFENCGLIDEIIVVAKEDELHMYDTYKVQYGFKKVTRIVKGGGTRQESVRNGFDVISDDSKFVAIHDAARCLITPKDIEKVCLEAYKTHAATAATAAMDTVKESDKHRFINSTLDRNRIWLAQTPQVFYVPLYRAASYNALKENFSATDDNSLIERIKNPVKLVDCGRMNFKITTHDDIEFAEAVIQLRENKEKQE